MFILTEVQINPSASIKLSVETSQLGVNAQKPALL